MNIQYKHVLAPLFFSLVTSQSLFAHGFQTAPYSRIAFTVDTEQKALLNYNPNQISNNLPTNFGTMTLQEIINYASETNGTGPLAFYKDKYPVKNDQLCAYAANNQGYLPILNKSLPETKMTEVSAGDSVQFKWGYTAWHTPSNNFVFVTEYPAGKYKPNPSLNDLHFFCAVPADSSGAWTCKMPTYKGDEKQVLVTIWQRVDAAGENFISCADLKVKNGTVVPPERIWSLLDDKKTWLTSLPRQPIAGEKITFKLEGKNTETLQTTQLASYSLSITNVNLSNWESILAATINNDSTNQKIIAIGELNPTQGNVIYNETQPTNNYVYLNKTISNPSVSYSYSLTAAKDTNVTALSWQQVGEPLKLWVNSKNVKINDNLQFALQVAGVEQTIQTVTVSDVANVEKLVAEEINKTTFKGLKIAAGVLQGSGQQSTVKFVAGGNNRVYVNRSTDDTTAISYVVRNLTQNKTYPIYPVGIGSYKADSLVQNEAGQVYICVESGWCNLRAYDLTSSAWKAIYPKPAPAGYLTFPAGKPYSNNDVAADIEGNLYKCKQAAWCNNSSGVYSPGTGRAWMSAWEKL